MTSGHRITLDEYRQIVREATANGRYYDWPGSSVMSGDNLGDRVITANENPDYSRYMKMMNESFEGLTGDDFIVLYFDSGDGNSAIYRSHPFEGKKNTSYYTIRRSDEQNPWGFREYEIIEEE